ncbi:molybdopterin-synthase adenylyltransferase MoeB [Agaribacter marinus]|uniref:Molybdopterin-synthase adenylyltransferase n=1 Tax=Agaribacter marinus TaxID=1431249 RepID=A0AA37T0T5_9ALTE|nr:molybdopterin-synthase adenylyltransferase MoeB [Agaribacter marinus]GLR71670.1 molybdopterin-synthase adenylyltransferase MoeB [Agaribacter marinus]
MKKTLSTQQAMRYSRHILLSGFDLDRQEILINANVAIIGVGGLGCAAAQYLAASGVGKLTIVDDDVVENTNLQRQVLHTESAIGLKKVDSAYTSLTKLNSEIDITCIDKRQSETELMGLVKTHDLIVDCSDNIETRNLINKCSYAKKTPLVSGAAIRMEGQVFCVVPEQGSACYACISQFFGEQNLSCVESGVMSPLVGVIGATQAIEAIKILTNYGTPAINKLCLYDAMTAKWNEFAVKRSDSCSVCGKT